MKHDFKVVIILITLFLASQLIGLGVINGYLDKEVTAETGNATWVDLPNVACVQVERPDLKENTS